MLKAFLTTLKGKIIVGIAGVVVTAGVVAGTVAVVQNTGYRSIAVNEVSGSVTVEGEKRSGDLIVGEHLYDGDYVSVGTLSGLTICADKSKYLYADEETEFKITSTKKKGATIKIDMTAGSTLHELKAKLGANDVYEVNTPNSTMSVRGTTFRVTVYKTNEGIYYTLTEVTNGNVVVKLKDEVGGYTGEETSIGEGESALMRTEGDHSEFVRSKTGDDSLILDYENLPEDSIDRLIELITEPKELVRPHEHIEGEWVVDTEPTCTTTGIRVKRCTICDEVLLIETLDKIDHEAGDWEFNPEPTCTEPGIREKKCKYCGLVMETEELEALGHTESDWIVTTEPTCTTRGAREIRCTVCDEVLKTENLRALGHSYGNWTVTKEANCTEAGSRRRVCSRCEATATETIAALGHDWYETGRDSLSCADNHDGYIYEKCSRCGATTTEYLARPSHRWIARNDTPDHWQDATCYEDGRHMYMCEVCHAIDERVDPARGYHICADVNALEATGDPGVYMATCASCGEHFYCDENGNDLGN